MMAAKPEKDGGITMQFFNSEETEKTFTLLINGKSAKITMKKQEIVSVGYKDGEFNCD